LCRRLGSEESEGGATGSQGRQKVKPGERRRDAQAGSVAFAPLVSKLRPPRSHDALVERRHVVRQLLDSTAGVVLLSAPAGSGKTVALKQWAVAERRPVGWLQLDDADNDPRLFASYICAVLDRMVGLDAGVFAALERPKPRVRQEVLPAIGASVSGARPFALVLDDCHTVETPECWEFVEDLRRLLPDGATLALGSRVPPPLPLPRLRAEGELLELRLDELAFDADETAELVGLLGLDVDPETLAALLDVTEGWATGIYLAALVSGGRSVDEWLPNVSGDQRDIAAYLLDEVLGRQPPDLCAFLEQTSILEAVCGPLAVATTGRQDAGEVLVRLARENLFVSALDDREEWYRYHHLFAELLQSRLSRRDPARLAALHRAAAVWHEEHGDPERSVRHYLAAGDVAATVRLTARTVDRYLCTERPVSAYRLMKVFTEEQILAHEQLVICAGWMFVLAGGTAEEQRRWTELLRTYRFDDGPACDGFTTLRASYLTIMAELALDGVAQMRRDFEEVGRLEKDGRWDVRVGNWTGVALSHYLSGAPARARRQYLAVLKRVTDPETIAGSHKMLALIAADEGRWDEAEEHLAEAERLTPGLGLDVEPKLSMFLELLLVRLRVLSHRGDPQTLSFLDTVADFVAEMVHRAWWVLAQAYVTLGEVALEQGDLAATRRFLALAHREVDRVTDPGMLGPRVRRLSSALEERVLVDPVSPAERRVLELLPTHLTDRQIAEALFISHSTVKTHLRAIYRKLGVGTRAGAVTRARELGLLRR
jgi:LuxR family maltose regulon positive regulatory protein